MKGTKGLLLKAAWPAILSLLLSGCASSVPSATQSPTATGQEAGTAVTKTTAAPTVPSGTLKPGADQPASGGILTRSNFADPGSFDLQQENTVEPHLALANTYNGLARFAPDGSNNVAADLADKWEMSPDGQAYTFRLKNGIKWHDGKPFTAEDVKFSLERMAFWKEHKIVSPRGGSLLVSVKEVSVVAPDAVKIDLKYPTASFVSNIACGWVVIMPRHVIEEKGDMRRVVVGTGAFKMQDFTPGLGFKLVKNPDYFIKGLPYLDGINIFVIRDDATRFAAFRTGRVLMTGVASRALSHADAELLRKEMPDKITVITHPAHSKYTVFINTQRKPWDDVRVRKAAHLAVDRQAAIKVNFNVGAIGTVMDPKGAWGIPEEEIVKRPGFRQPKDQDTAESKRLLTEAGYAQGFKAGLMIRTGRVGEAFGSVVKDQLGKIGIDLQLDVKELSAMQDIMNRRGHELFLWQPTGMYDDPDATLGSYYPTGAAANYSQLSDKQLDDLFQKQSATSDIAQRKKLVAEMQERIMELMPDITMFWDQYNMGFWKQVRDYKPGGGPYTHNNLDHVWLAK